MESSDLELIEKELGIELPEFYMSTMLEYPFTDNSWGAEFSLSNDPQHILNMNKEFLGGEQSFAIGSDGGEFIYFLKLGEADKVYVYDYEGSEAHLSVEAESWPEYLMQIEKMDRELLLDELQDRERRANKKWWQFWI